MVSMLTRGWTYCVMTEMGERDIKDEGPSTGARSFRVLLETPMIVLHAETHDN